MAQARVNGVELAWQQHGAGPDLVFVHGLAASRAFWFQHYALPLARHFRVTLYDLRGHGYSSRAESGHDAVTQAADLAGLLEHLGIERCALVGHSYGGGIALEYALRQPDTVTRLAIMDTKINRLQPQQMLADSPFPLSPFELEVAGQYPRDWESEPQIGLSFLEVMARWRLAGAQSRTRDAYVPFGEGRGALRSARQWLALIERAGVREEFIRPGADARALAALAMPLLLLYGERSRCLPSCRALAALLPQAQVEIIPQGGHFFPISDAATVMRRLAAFLNLAPQSELGTERAAAQAPT